VNRVAWVLAVALGLCLVSVGVSLLRRPAPEPLPSMTVEVLNGCGVEGLAARTARTLRALGQDVIRVDDAERQDHVRTLLVDRRGRPRLARRLAQRLSGEGPAPLVVLERLEDPPADLTLILGRDRARAGAEER
jgi:hypothetical protein